MVVPATSARPIPTRPKGRPPARERLRSRSPAYLEDLGERVRALRDRGLSPRRICRRLFGRPLPINYLTLGHFSGMHLVRSYLAGFSPAQRTPEQPEEDETLEHRDETPSEP